MVPYSLLEARRQGQRDLEPGDVGEDLTLVIKYLVN